jgi:hypothetical protein
MLNSHLTFPLHPSCIRVVTQTGQVERYRNDPYGAVVMAAPLPPIRPRTDIFRAHAAEGLTEPSATPASPSGVPLPKMPFAARKKSDVARSLEYSSLRGPDSMVNRNALSFPHEDSQQRVLCVRFKREKGAYRCCGIPARIGDFAVVEADRGYNIGVVESILSTAVIENRTRPSVIRMATADEVVALKATRAEECDATERVRLHVKELNLSMEVVDVEYQFDRNKLTVYFTTAGGRCVDFRGLQRLLFKEFGCRIWLCQSSLAGH